MKLKGRDFLCLKDFDRDEIRFLLDLAHDFKRKKKIGESHELFRGKAAALIFEKHSTRTRVSLEVACNDLGILPMYMSRDQLQLARGEPIKDTARVLSRMSDAILARVYGHSDVEELAKYADVPVINALSDKFHPLQILADLMTIEEHKGKLSGLKLAWVGDGNNVANSLLIGCSKMGINMYVATPKGYEPPEDVVSLAMNFAKESNAEIVITNDPIEAVTNADIVVTDTFVSMGEESKAKEKLKAFENYVVTSELCSHAKPDYVFMHCLPYKHKEATEDVFESSHSIVFDEAENRLYTIMAVLKEFVK